MLKLAIKSLLFLLILFASYGILMAVAPLNLFTFRCWEAVLTSKYFPGFKFYPNVTLHVTETGDLGHHTPLAVKKHVTWQTDRYGYRIKDEINNAPYDIVIVGDSNIVGSGMSQEHTIAEKLTVSIQRNVYPFAPQSFIDFINLPRFRHSPPKTVIFEVVERDIPEILPLTVVNNLPTFEPITAEQNTAVQYRMEQKFKIWKDRIFKKEFSRYVKARLRTDNLYLNLIAPDGKTFFTLDELDRRIIREDKIEPVTAILKSYADYCKSQNMRFIFMPLPNKSNIYQDILPEQYKRQKPDFLDKLVPRLEKEGIEVIDVLSPLREAYARGVQVYLTDDSHWSPEGVKIVTETIKEKTK